MNRFIGYLILCAIEFTCGYVCGHTRNKDNAPKAPRTKPIPLIKRNEYIGYKDNSNLVGMRVVPACKSGPPNPPCRQPCNNELTIKVLVDTNERFTIDDSQKLASFLKTNFDINTSKRGWLVDETVRLLNIMKMREGTKR